MIYKIILIALLVIPSFAWAAPSVTGVSGTVSNGESITIAGTAFGSTGPTVALFDDFEGGTNGAYIGDGVTNAVIGTWEDCGASCTPTYYSIYSIIL